MKDPRILLHDNQAGHWLNFSAPYAVIEARTLAEVIPALEEADSLVNARHLWAAGFVSYEAGPAFDQAMTTHPPGALPLVWFGLFETPEIVPPPSPATVPAMEWLPNQGLLEYHHAVRKIKSHIALGDTYQVNYTIRMRSVFTGTPNELFAVLASSQQSAYAAFIETDRFAVCSISPELFFKLDGTRLTSKPMKGTAARGLSADEDQSNAAQLQVSEKNRAENLMIVDMVRNDMGRIARTGSVQVPRLFDIERYPSVLQMTSTVQCETEASIPEIYRALFPCASITGAPKIRTMEIIRNLEKGPRGVYTGSIGFWTPDRRAQFNVAIRTAVLNLQSGETEYGTGSGIVWDSVADDEYAECLLKTQVLATAPLEDFQLIETLRWSPTSGFFLLDRHMERLKASAIYFNFPFEATKLQQQLDRVQITWGQTVKKVRLLLNSYGNMRIEAETINSIPAGLLPTPFDNPLPADFAAFPINTRDVFLYHKTTRRDVYTAAHASRPGIPYVLLWNIDRELTEFTTANLVIRLGNELLTPPVSCGLLPGTFRSELLAQGIVKEISIRRIDLESAQEIWAVNSVRGWQPVRLVTGDEHPGSFRDKIVAELTEQLT